MGKNKFKFELHTHTVHSDGAFTPKELVESAKKHGYYGIALTDHNTTSGCDSAVEWGKKLGVLVIPGIEWTTFYGHIVVLGGNSKVDWRKVNPDTVIELIEEARAAGDVVGLAHPYRVGYPVCTGGKNQFPKEIFEHLDFYEAVSGEIDDPSNLSAILEYNELKSRGYSLSAAYGRDWHKDADKSGAKYGATYLLSDKEKLNLTEAIELIKSGCTLVGYRDTANNILEEKI
ncbi:MAG: CehA/McbA family metallohydrolase [Clostridia bacterium]|nr:CehA/McbA family metallohydrolase [Clostridia bacterium]